MGLLDRFNKAMDKGRELARTVQDKAESAVGQGARAATGQAAVPLPSVQGGRDVFSPLVANANNIGYAYVARSESIDAVGYTLHSNRHGLHVDDIDVGSGGSRVTVEALGHPVGSLVEWEVVKRLLSDGEDEEVSYQAADTVRFLTHQISGGWQCSFLRRRLVVRVRFEGPGATRHLARDFAANVCWHHLDLAALDAWLAELGVDGSADLNTEVLPGTFTVPPTPPAAPSRLNVEVPIATDVAAAVIDPMTPDRVYHDWDEFRPGADVLGWEPGDPSIVRLGRWEGISLSGPNGQFAHVLASDVPEAVADPAAWGALLLEAASRPAPYEGSSVTVGLDPWGYPVAHAVIGGTPFIAKLSGPPGNAGGLDAAYRFALAAIEAMPE